MKKSLLILIILMVIPGICIAENRSADGIYTAGMEALKEERYETAIELFNQSMNAYDLDGNTSAARTALQKKNRSSWILLEMGFNKTMAEEALSAGLPDLSRSARDQVLEPGQSIQIKSDGETRYFIGIANNAAFHNVTIMQDLSREQNHSAFFDEVFPLIMTNESFDDWYGNPHTFTANSSLSIPTGDSASKRDFEGLDSPPG